VGQVIAIAAVLSGFGAAISNLNAASRMLYAFGRDGFITKRLGFIHPRYGTPVVSLGVVWVVQACLILAFSGTTYLNVFGWFGTTGSVAFILAYLSTVIAATAHFRRYLTAIIPAAGIVIVAYVLYQTIWPFPPYPLNLFVYFVLAWLLLACVLLATSSRLRSRIANSPYLALLKKSDA
jgi:amino acid transporter